MADDTIEVIVPFQNRSSDPPASSTGYDFKVLSQDQQRELNNLKIHTVRENHLYLNAHPEIPALLTLLLRAVFKHKPRNIHDFLATYTKRPRLRLAVKRLIEQQQQQQQQQQQLSTEKSSVEVGKQPFSLANVVFPSSLKVEEYQVDEVEKVDKTSAIVGEDIMSEILTLVEEKITQKECYQMAKSILDDAVTDFKPSMYPPCEPKLYRHSTSEKERQAKESAFVVEGIKDEILSLQDERIAQIEDIGA